MKNFFVLTVLDWEKKLKVGKYRPCLRLFVLSYFVCFSYVADDMLMKDNAEGRNEQNVLYQLLESAKKMERKKKRKSTDLRIRASTDSNPSPIPSETSPETKVGKLNTIL